MTEDKLAKNADWMEDYEGQLAVDVFQTEDNVVLKAPLAGVKPEDLELSITDEVVTIKGERKEVEEIKRENYLAQECYWGAFARSYVLPMPVTSEKAQATLKNGILTITLPKQEKTKAKKIEIKTE
ncbi:MAG: Hsp20/alpha crystallin family protein [Patescibacteria group bacterium]|nr:Hsp20/alpha crystallin family protein [Patescibacteria group bacterium]